MSRMMKESPASIGKKAALNASAINDNTSMFMTEPPSAIKVQQNGKVPPNNAYGAYNTGVVMKGQTNRYQMSSGLRQSGF